MKRRSNWKGLIVLISPFFLSVIAIAQPKEVKLVVLGVMQDGGLPQLGCTKFCCVASTNRKTVSSLALVEPMKHRFSLLDATPDIVVQCKMVDSLFRGVKLHSIFLTHAHMGHYTGILHLGREAMNAKNIPLYVMPRMANFIFTNGPWSQLVQLNNISLTTIQNDVSIENENFSITPILVPHRDEFSETVGYRVKGPNKSILFIPDIDKWSKWSRSLIAEIEKVDYAFLDGTFFADGEVDRPMSEIPHPFITETMSLLNDAPASIKKRVYFIHFNHTNPLINPLSSERKKVEELGYQIAKEGAVFSL
ncbi:MAG: pyrroloquinoline quinone biosynthesis protein PqqB [Chitinophagaceae bacterium]|nr:pyrroloquinoline quinone biosynthesis protein PqqB [Chitinophagaceae bacterium]